MRTAPVLQFAMVFELTVPLDAAFNIAIQLFRMIDAGGDGLDDKMAEELEKIRVKYLGQ